MAEMIITVTFNTLNASSNKAIHLAANTIGNRLSYRDFTD